MLRSYARQVSIQNSFEAVALQKPRDNQDHDRLLFNDASHLFGVFDGAGSDIASNFALDTIRKYTAKLSPELLSLHTPADMIGHTHSELMKWLNPQISLLKTSGFNAANCALTTASIVKLRKNARGLLCSYASAGDSPIYHLSRTQGVTPLADDESDQTPPHYDEIANFLGSTEHRLTKYGQVQLEEGDSVIIATDGVISKQFQDGTDPEI